MTVLSEGKWDSLEFPDYRARFFVETWKMSLSGKTPHFFHARFNGVFSILSEVISLLIEYEKNDRVVASLVSCMEEAVEIIKADDVIGTVASDPVSLFVKRAGEFIKDKGCRRKVSRQILQIAEYVYSFRRVYFNELIEKLKGSVLGDFDKNKIARSLDEIFILSRLLVTHLLYINYSETYLYVRAELLTYKSRYKGRSFKEQFNYFLSRFEDNDVKYTVYAGYKFLRSADNPRPYLGMKFVSNEEDVDWYLEKFEVGQCSGVVSASVMAKDYIGAAWKAFSKFSHYLDLYAFEYKDERFLLSERYGVVHHHEKNDYRHNVHVALLRKLLVKRNDLYEIKLKHFVYEFFEKDGVSFEMRDSFVRFLRHYRLGITASNFESRFLSMWICCEFLCEGEGESIIDRVLSSFPSIYAFESLSRRISYLDDLLCRYGFEFPVEESHYDITKKLNRMRGIYATFSDNKALKETLDGFGENEYLKYVYLKVRSDLCDKEAVLKRFERTKIDVDRQIRRAYYMRNLVVHRAHDVTVSHRLYLHLCDYVNVIISELLTSLDDAVNPKDFSALFRGLLLALESKFDVWWDKETLSFDDIVFSTPYV